MRRDIAAIILGAHEWPQYEGFKSSNSFLNSARDFTKYLVEGGGLDISEDNILDLFDSPDGVDVINRKVRVFLEKTSKSPTVKNLIVYYTGHGAFVGPKEYCLALRSSQKNALDTSAYRMASSKNRKFSVL